MRGALDDPKRVTIPIPLVNAPWRVELHDFEEFLGLRVPLIGRLLEQRRGRDMAPRDAGSERRDCILPVLSTVAGVGFVGAPFEVETPQCELGAGVSLFGVGQEAMAEGRPVQAREAVSFLLCGLGA